MNKADLTFLALIWASITAVIVFVAADRLFELKRMKHRALALALCFMMALGSGMLFIQQLMIAELTAKYEEVSRPPRLEIPNADLTYYFAGEAYQELLVQHEQNLALIEELERRLDALVERGY